MCFICFNVDQYFLGHSGLSICVHHEHHICYLQAHLLNMDVIKMEINRRFSDSFEYNSNASQLHGPINAIAASGKSINTIGVDPKGSEFMKNRMTISEPLLRGSLYDGDSQGKNLGTPIFEKASTLPRNFTTNQNASSQIVIMRCERYMICYL